jgi:glycosyltransferase involved in cell wall biosynthesis
VKHRTGSPGAWRRKNRTDIRVDVVVPVLNEAHVLEKSVRTLAAFLQQHIALDWGIVIAENGSTDGTAEAGARLARELPGVQLLTIGQRGRGRALRIAWTRSKADIVCYTDVDLSTELDAFPALFRALIDESYDLAIGSRLAAGSQTTRSLKRELISRAYNQILRWSLDVGFSDAQCGFKAVTREVVDRVLPLVKDESWFLDTELLVLAEHLGYRIADVPVRWIEDDDSRVKIVQTAWEDLKGVARVRRAIRSPLRSPHSAATPAAIANDAASLTAPFRTSSRIP